MNEKEINITEIERKIKKGIMLFFDFDGTLVDTNYANFLAYEKAVKAILNENLLFNNKRFTREKLRIVFPDLAKKKFNEIIKKKDLFYKDFLAETKPNKIVCEILNKFSKTNKTVLVTNSRERRALLTLKYHNIEMKFDDIFYRQINGTKRINKYQVAITKLDVLPLLILVFENELSEISDAISAGIPNENIISINN